MSEHSLHQEIERNVSDLSPEERLERRLVALFEEGTIFSTSFFDTEREAIKAAKAFARKHTEALDANSAFEDIIIEVSGDGIEVADIVRDEQGSVLTVSNASIVLDSSETREGCYAVVRAEVVPCEDGKFKVTPILMLLDEEIEFKGYAPNKAIVSHTNITTYAQVPCRIEVGITIPSLDKMRALTMALGNAVLKYDDRHRLKQAISSLTAELREEPKSDDLVPLKAMKSLRSIGRASRLIPAEDRTLLELVDKLLCHRNSEVVVTAYMYTLQGIVYTDREMQGFLTGVIAGEPGVPEGGELTLVLECYATGPDEGDEFVRHYIPISRIKELKV